MINAAQQAAGIAAQFWIEAARHETAPEAKEAHVQRAIRNLMVASHGR